jgi:hypothetical protein
MSNQLHHENWHVLADRFIWSDENALSLIPKEISDEEIQRYLYTYHGDDISIREIKKWRKQRVEDQ